MGLGVQRFPQHPDVVHLYVNFLGVSGRWLECLDVIEAKLAVASGRSLLAMLHFLRAQALVQVVKHQYALVHPETSPRTSLRIWPTLVTLGFFYP